MKERGNISASNFIVFSLPGEQKYVYHDIEKYSNRIESLSDYDFVIAPFDRDINKTYYLKLREGQTNKPFRCNIDTKGQLSSTDKSAYTSAFNRCKDLLDSNELRKIVLSRIKCIQSDHTKPHEIFIKLVKKYKEAFVYLFYIEDECWIGATPELLLNKQLDRYHTVALAGTQKAAKNGELIHWNKKEIGEHAFIEQHLIEHFNIAGINYQISEPYNQQAGSMVHIKSDIIFDSTLKQESILKLIHPGPAISGYDAEKSKKYIREIEGHDRSFYAGYLGLTNKQNLELFVNLRCMRVFNDQYCLYLGGGLLPDSDLNQEWEETEIKATTMQSIIETINE